MASRVGVDAEAGFAAATAAQQHGAQAQHARLRVADVVHLDVEVALLRVRRIGPLRRLVVGDLLEASRGWPPWSESVTQPGSVSLARTASPVSSA